MKTIKTLAFLATMLVAATACSQNNEPKFDAKEYAQRKTERIDKIVELSDAQEKEVYAIYLEQGKTLKKEMKNMKKECNKAECDKKAECKKAECDKANCDKANCDKKAECKKAECDKANCNKAECKKAECDKANCDKKAECKKAECKKAECDKANCDKKAECKKVAHHKAPHKRHMLNPEVRKATFEKLQKVLTPEQLEVLKAHHAKRHMCAPSSKECCPTPAQPANK